MSHAYNEIKNQPRAWEQTIPATLQQWDSIAPSIHLQPSTHFLIAGSGTSFYIAQSAAQCMQAVTGFSASAVPSSEIFLSPDSVLPRNVPVLAFVISRSGTTSEALLAADYLRRRQGDIDVVGITCYPGAALTREAGRAIVLAHAAEQSVVMTQSFTSLLLALQVVAARIAGDAELLDGLSTVPRLCAALEDEYEQFGRTVGSDPRARQFIFLGLGPNRGLAEEGTLKMKEMTQTPCEAYNPLEFRHGPISIVEPGTTVVMLEGLREGAYLADLETDLVSQGGAVAAIGPQRPSGAGSRLTLPSDLSDVARCVLYLPALQYLAYYRALALGLEPDHPRNLTQVVVLRG